MVKLAPIVRILRALALIIHAGCTVGCRDGQITL